MSLLKAAMAFDGRLWPVAHTHRVEENPPIRLISCNGERSIVEIGSNLIGEMLVCSGGKVKMEMRDHEGFWCTVRHSSKLS